MRSVASCSQLPWSIFVSLALGVSAAPAQEKAATAPGSNPGVHVASLGCCPLTLDRLMHMSKQELEDLYCHAPPAPMLVGYLRGKAIRHAGSKWAVPSACVSGIFWKGKLFDACDGTLLNKWCFGIRAVKASISCGESWLDGKPALIMDYRGVSSVVWKDVRDELREVAPGLYLGAMFKDKCPNPRFQMFFALECK